MVNVVSQVSVPGYTGHRRSASINIVNMDESRTMTREQIVAAANDIFSVLSEHVDLAVISKLASVIDNAVSERIIARRTLSQGINEKISPELAHDLEQAFMSDLEDQPTHNGYMAMIREWERTLARKVYAGNGKPELGVLVASL